MDWHFRVHQRVAEAERRGQHRSWFVDEMDWIRSHEEADVEWVSPASLDDVNANGGAGGGGSSAGGQGGRAGEKAGGGGSKEKKQYIPVPEDASRINSACPICQEKFEMKWLDEAQEWVWMDAMMVGSAGNKRVFHASCYREVHGNSGSGGQGQGGAGYRATPERVLGKRKAEVSF